MGGRAPHPRPTDAFWASRKRPDHHLGTRLQLGNYRYQRRLVVLVKAAIAAVAEEVSRLAADEFLVRYWAALDLADRKVGVDQPVGVPLAQKAQNLFDLGPSPAPNDLAAAQHPAVRHDPVGPKDRAKYIEPSLCVGTHAVGVLYPIAIWVLVAKFPQRRVHLVEGLRHLVDADVAQPVHPPDPRHWIAQAAAPSGDAVIGPLPVGVEPRRGCVLVEIAHVVGRMFLDDLIGNGQRIAVVSVLLHHDRIAGVEQIGHITAGKDQRSAPHIGKMTGKQRLEIDVEPRFEPLFDPSPLARSGKARDAHPRDLEPLLWVVNHRIPVDAQLCLCRLRSLCLPLGESIHSANASEKR